MILCQICLTPNELRADAQPAVCIACGAALAASPVAMDWDDEPTPVPRLAWRDVSTDVAFDAPLPAGAAPPPLPPPHLPPIAHTAPQAMRAPPPFPPAAGPRTEPTEPHDDALDYDGPSSVVGPGIHTQDVDGSFPIVPLNALISQRYLVTEHIAEGGFARVYRVRDTVGYLEEELAIKIPRSGDAPDVLGARLKSQLKVWKVLSELAPTSVVRLRAVEKVEWQGQLGVGIFMEHMPGGSLLRHAQNVWGGSPKNHDHLVEAVRLLAQATEALAVLHQQKLLHRDVKPANFLLDASCSHCKLADFELVIEGGDEAGAPAVGTFAYIAPESHELGSYSTASDIFALGATFFHVLTGELPFGSAAPHERDRSPVDLSARNPLVPSALHHLVARCLEREPSHRPQSVLEVLHELRRLGLGSDSNTAPVNLAKLLMAHLPNADIEFHVELLEKRGYRSARSDGSERHADVIEEYCYTAPPDEILLEMSNVRQLLGMAEGLGLAIPSGAGRDLIVDEILKVLGFRSRIKQIEGMQWALARLERQLVELEHAATHDECVSIVRSGLTVLEQATDVVLRFFGQLVYGSGITGYLAHICSAPRPVRLTLGQKVHALSDVALRPPPFSLEPRAVRVFRWPLLPQDLFESFRPVVAVRNDLAHGRPLGRDFHHAQLEGRMALSTAVEIVRRVADHPHTPRVVQIVSRQDDEYGRHFFLGRDDRGRVERVFTPLPLQVGTLYLLYPLTNPARINPLIFPYALGPG